MLDQYVTDNFPTVKAPLEAWPIMPADAYNRPLRARPRSSSYRQRRLSSVAASRHVRPKTWSKA